MARTDDFWESDSEGSQPDQFGLRAAAVGERVDIVLSGSHRPVEALARLLAKLPGVVFLDGGQLFQPGNFGSWRVRFRVRAVLTASGFEAAKAILLPDSEK
jgi:hypothetical protein